MILHIGRFGVESIGKGIKRASGSRNECSGTTTKVVGTLAGCGSFRK